MDRLSRAEALVKTLLCDPAVATRWVVTLPTDLEWNGEEHPRGTDRTFEVLGVMLAVGQTGDPDQGDWRRAAAVRIYVDVSQLDLDDATAMNAVFVEKDHEPAVEWRTTATRRHSLAGARSFDVAA